MHDDRWIQFLFNNNRYRVRVIWGSICIFANPDHRPDMEFFDARRWFIARQREFNLEGLIDPESELVGVSDESTRTHQD